MNESTSNDEIYFITMKTNCYIVMKQVKRIIIGWGHWVTEVQMFFYWLFLLLADPAMKTSPKRLLDILFLVFHRLLCMFDPWLVFNKMLMLVDHAQIVYSYLSFTMLHFQLLIIDKLYLLIAVDLRVETLCSNRAYCARGNQTR